MAPHFPWFCFFFYIGVSQGQSDSVRIATDYVVKTDGMIFDVFDPKCWAFYLGLKGTNGTVDKRSIGIEIGSEGGLTQRNPSPYCFDKVSERTRFTQDHYQHPELWRGFRFFDAYSDAQATAVADLINLLCDQFKIPRKTPANHFDADDTYRTFEGIIGHHHVRPDKSDVHPGFPWQMTIDTCRLELT
jgi:N-acetyl-anhydromuramyl-L-alanine amidase AmpD